MPRQKGKYKMEKAKRSSRFLRVAAIIGSLLLAVVIAANIIVIMGEQGSDRCEVVSKIPDIFSQDEKLSSMTISDLNAGQHGYYKNIAVDIFKDENCSEKVAEWKIYGSRAQAEIVKSFDNGAESIVITATKTGLKEINDSSPVLNGQLGYGGCWIVVSYDYTYLNETAYSIRKCTLETWRFLESLFD